MIFCSECGTKNKDMAKFCRKCGASLLFDEDEEFEEEVVEEKPAKVNPKPTVKPAEEKASRYKPIEPIPKEDPIIKDTPLPQNKEGYEDYEDEAEEYVEEISEENQEIEEEYVDDEPEYTVVVEDEESNVSEEEEYIDDEDIEEGSEEEISSSIVTNPANDSYWNDVVPEIEEEIYKIPKDIILKFVFGGLAILALVIILICAL
jgi:hypothetical protein